MVLLAKDRMGVNMHTCLRSFLAFGMAISATIADAADQKSVSAAPKINVVVEVPIKMPKQMSPNEEQCQYIRDPRNWRTNKLPDSIENIQSLLPILSPAQIAGLKKHYEELVAAGNMGATNDFVTKPEYQLIGFREHLEELKADLAALDAPLLPVKQRIIILTDVLKRVEYALERWAEFSKSPAGRRLPPAAVKRAGEMLDERSGIENEIRCWSFAIHELPMLGVSKH